MAVTRRVIVGTGVAGTAGLLVGAGSAWATVENPGTPEVIATDPDATPVGGSLTVYSGRNEGLVGPLIESIEQVLGIDIEVRYGNTAELAATILEEGNNSPADVFLSQDGGSLGAVAKAGAFTALPQATLDKVAPEFRSDDGLWIGVSGRARVLAYNTENVDPATLPASVEALTDPAWKGQIGWAPTNASFQTFVTAFRLLKGEDAARAWLEGMIANDTVVFEGNGEAVRAVSAGEIQAALVNHYYRYEISAEEGEEIPVANHFFAGGDVGSLVNVAGSVFLVPPRTRSRRRHLSITCSPPPPRATSRSRPSSIRLSMGLSHTKDSSRLRRSTHQKSISMTLMTWKGRSFFSPTSV